MHSFMRFAGEAVTVGIVDNYHLRNHDIGVLQNKNDPNDRYICSASHGILTEGQMKVEKPDLNIMRFPTFKTENDRKATQRSFCDSLKKLLETLKSKATKLHAVNLSMGSGHTLQLLRQAYSQLTMANLPEYRDRIWTYHWQAEKKERLKLAQEITATVPTFIASGNEPNNINEALLAKGSIGVGPVNADGTIPNRSPVHPLVHLRYSFPEYVVPVWDAAKKLLGLTWSKTASEAAKTGAVPVIPPNEVNIRRPDGAQPEGTLADLGDRLDEYVWVPEKLGGSSMAAPHGTVAGGTANAETPQAEQKNDPADGHPWGWLLRKLQALKSPPAQKAS